MSRHLKREQFVCDFFKTQHVELTSITSDASFRKYFRVNHQEQTYILMDAPIELCDNEPFIHLNQVFTLGGLNVPKILSHSGDEGLVLLEDLGQVHLADKLAEPSAVQYYQEILSLIPHIAKLPSHPAMKPYDASFIAQEMDIFKTWLCESYLKLDLDTSWQDRWQLLVDKLATAMLEQPQVTMHRDFHSRNLMYADGKWRVIDYQDAVQGPVTYDAVSLLRDCYYKLPTEQFEQLQKHSFELLKDAQLIVNWCYSDYQVAFDLTGLQRHIKAAGIFARLYIRDDKAGYLDNIIPTLEYIVEISNRYPELSWFATWINESLIPVLHRRREAP